MDLILNSIGEILIKDNFIQFCIILSMLRNKPLKTLGTILLFAQLFIGYKWFIYVIALIIVIYVAGNDE